MRARNVDVFFKRLFVWRANGYVVFGIIAAGEYVSIFSWRSASLIEKPRVESSRFGLFLKPERGLFSGGEKER